MCQMSDVKDMNLNRVMLIGNLTRNPELRTIPSGQSVCSFGIATNRQWTNQQTGQKQEQVEFHNIVAWGKLAEICNQYLVKGKKVYAEGRLQTREWEGQDGVKRQRTEIVLENMIMLDRMGGASGGPVSKGAEMADTGGNAAPTEEIKMEDIPF